MWRVGPLNLDVTFSGLSGWEDFSLVVANTQQMLFRLPLSLALAALNQTLRGLRDSRQVTWVEIFLCAACKVHKHVSSYVPPSSLWRELLISPCSECGIWHSARLITYQGHTVYPCQDLG